MSTIPKNINNIFFVNEKIGNGSFGEVYMAKFKKKNGEIKDVAIKFEPLTSQSIRREIDIIKTLKGNVGFARIFGSGTASGYRFLAMELLGPSLDMFLKKRGRPFQLETVCKIGENLVDRLEVLHKKMFVHCDLKPENIAVGRNNQSDIYLIDFGCATKITNLSVPLKTSTIIGTLRFISVAAHEGIISFQSDIESLGYVLAYLVTGELPWGLEVIAKEVANVNNLIEVYAAVMNMKKSTFEKLLHSLPKPITSFLAASRCITHTQMPDYNVLRNILK